MGYAGYFSTTNRLKDKATPLQAALATIDTAASLEVLEKLLYNIAVMPAEKKYRKIKCSNPKIQVNIVDKAGAKEALALLGWIEVIEAEETFLTLPDGKLITMSDVRDVQAAQQELSKKEKDLKRSASAAKLPGSTDQQRLRAQLEADRKERAAAQV